MEKMTGHLLICGRYCDMSYQFLRQDIDEDRYSSDSIFQRTVNVHTKAHNERPVATGHNNFSNKSLNMKPKIHRSIKEEDVYSVKIRLT
jgi:hypothetical protein